MHWCDIGLFCLRVIAVTGLMLCILLCCVGIQDSLKVELSLAEARVESSRRKIEAEMQMRLEQQVSGWNFCGRLCNCYFITSCAHFFYVMDYIHYTKILLYFLSLEYGTSFQRKVFFLEIP